jgi:hypothetical protein
MLDAPAPISKDKKLGNLATADFLQELWPRCHVFPR